MPAVRVLVAYYSRSGNSRAIAMEIARAFGGADLEEIRDTAKRGGLFGYFRSARDAMKQRSTLLAAPGRDVSNYDLVVIGGPVWVGNVSPPVRAYLDAHREEFTRVAYFVTHGGTGRDKAFGQMTEIGGHHPTAVMAVRERELRGLTFMPKLVAFVSTLADVLEPLAASRHRSALDRKHEPPVLSAR